MGATSAAAHARASVLDDSQALPPPAFPPSSQPDSVVLASASGVCHDYSPDFVSSVGFDQTSTGQISHSVGHVPVNVSADGFGSNPSSSGVGKSTDFYRHASAAKESTELSRHASGSITEADVSPFQHHLLDVLNRLEGAISSVKAKVAVLESNQESI